MARFYQQVKTLISDIEKFLNVAIKDAKIPKAAQTQKSSILSQIAELRNDYPQLEINEEEQPQHNTQEPSPQECDDIYEDTDSAQATLRALDREDLLKKEVPATDTQNVIYSGLMKLRKDKKGNFMSKLTKLKQFAVLRDDIFYIYEKKSSKKQSECFSIEGYKVTQVEDEGKKEHVFELAHDNKKNYIIEVGSSEELQIWLTKLNESPFTITDVIENQGSTSQPPEDDDDLYEDTDALTAGRAPIISTSESPPPLPKSAHPPRPSPATPSAPPPALPARSLPPAPTPAAGDDEQIYEEGDADNNTTSTPSGESFPKSSISNDDDQDIYDETEAPSDLPPPPAELLLPPAGQDDQNDIYDETDVTETAPPGPPPPSKNKSSLFSASLQQQSQRLDGNSPPASFRRAGGAPPPPPKKSLPPPPTNPKNGTPAPQDTDYENMFYGVWDCTADQEKELSFRRGDIITVINRKYDDRGWWVGRLHEKIGLVPKEFLSPAYERA